MPFKKGEVAHRNGSRPRYTFNALLMELKAAGEDMPQLRAIAQKAIQLAMDGNAEAREWVSNRLDGRVPQPYTGPDGEEAIQVHHTIIRKIVAPGELIELEGEPVPTSKPRLLTRQAKDVV
jgi:hypothetical protein